MLQQAYLVVHNKEDLDQVISDYKLTRLEIHYTNLCKAKVYLDYVGQFDLINDDLRVDYCDLEEPFTRDEMQRAVYNWAKELFGVHAVTPLERSRRLTEELLECVQAAGLTKSEVLSIVEAVYSEEPGPLDEELGDATFVLMAFAETHGLSLESCERLAWNKARSKSPEYWQARHQNKIDKGISQ